MSSRTTPGPDPPDHPSIFEPITLFLGVLLAILGVVIGLELLTRVGITPNSSIIAAVIAIAVSRVPLQIARPFADVSRQNLMQTIISGATFGGANAILLPIAVLWLIGAPELVPVMMIGAFAALVLDATILYRVFDSTIYPARGLWPSGVATAECIIAGDRGGKRARLLGVGGLVGGFGQYLGVPMDVFGVCWIGNIWALAMFALGLLTRGYTTAVFGLDLNALYMPHGVMIGAGVVAILQIVYVTRTASAAAESASSPTVDRHGVRQTLGRGFLAFGAIATGIALLGGIASSLTPGMLVGFILFAALAALVSELIVGISAMHAGWFPAFATALIFLVVGMLLGFPSVPLALLVGFTAATGPAFADMGYDLKAGWILRGNGRHPALEREGRKQQYFAELIGFTVAGLVVLFSYQHYFGNDLVPPVTRVFVATIEAGTTPGLAQSLLKWAIPGALVQLAGGPARQIGILFATGLLIYNPIAGWTAAVALIVRGLLLRKYGESVQNPMYVLAGGFIAGAALTSFGAAALKAR